MKLNYKQRGLRLRTIWQNFWLVIKYPFLKPSLGYGTDMCYHHKGYHYLFEETWLDNIPYGWRKMVLEFCDRLKKIIKEDNLKEYAIHQVKEKWGELCWYDEGGNERTRELISELEKQSCNTCIICGKSPTSYYTTGWITYICEDCANKYYADKKDKIKKLNKNKS